MPLLICLCGGKFADIDVLHEHAISKGHFYQCSPDDCGRLFQSMSSAQDHQKSVDHVGAIMRLDVLNNHASRPATGESASLKCVFCGPGKKPFKDTASLKQHKADKHPDCSTCPSCNQIFYAESKRLEHQRDARHCYCPEHNKAFSSAGDLQRHMKDEVHTTGFACMDCERVFETQRGLDHHLMACPAKMKDIAPEQSERARAAFEAMEEANLRCEECQRTFQDLKAFHQHKQSVKHKPLANLTCNVAPSKCNQPFTSYSAWFFHIESGKCKSGLNRKKLNALVHGRDGQHLITYAGITENGQLSLISGAGLHSDTAITESGSRFTELENEFDQLSVADSSVSGIILTPQDSDASSEISRTSGVILTPKSSDTGSDFGRESGVLLTPTASINSRSEWSFITDSHKLTPGTTSVSGSSTATITYENLTKINGAWPCDTCSRNFKTKGGLLQHLNSPTHAPKLLRCPTASTLGLAVGRSGKAFKTLSGLAQHVEAGACDGGVDLLKKFIDICQTDGKAVAGKGSKLIAGAS